VTGWTKLFSSIVTSSVWVESHATVRVWIAMLACADADGVVEGSLPGFANIARVTVEEMRRAVETLSSPDPDSRTPDHAGRRLEAIAGGWRLLNYVAYRERGQAKEGSRAPYYRAYRARLRAEAEAGAQGEAATVTATPGVARNTRGERREAEAEAGRRTGPAPDGASPAAAGGSAVARVFTHWQGTMGKAGARLTPKRAQQIRARLRDFSEDQLIAAIDGCRASGFHQGANGQGRRYDDLGLILRDVEHVEQFIELRSAPARVQVNSPKAIARDRADLAGLVAGLKGDGTVSISRLRGEDE
jgi:hypothetical protein